MKASNSFVVGLILMNIFGHSVHSQDQTIIHHTLIPATDIHDSIRFGIMLPINYNEKDVPYPTLYYLHGLNGSYSGWQSQKFAKFIKSNSEKGSFPECIVVIPDGGEGFWCNHYDQDPLLEDEIINVLIPYIDQNYSTDVGKRIIIGWSAGGMGAMILYAKHPRLFKASISLDGSIINWDDFLNFQGNRTEIIGNEAYYYENCSPHDWAAKNMHSINAKEDTSIFLAAGFFATQTKKYISILERQNTSFLYLELECGHEFNCVLDEVEEGLLEFLSNALQ